MTNITIKIPFLSWSGTPDLKVEIDAGIETRFHLRAAVIKAVSQHADLRSADLSCADLSCAKNAELTLAKTLIVPEVGAFEGFKKLANGEIAHLAIPAKAKRSNATGRKCRASEAKVLAIWDTDGKPTKLACSKHDESFKYMVGKIVKPDSFDENRWNECSNGIHFFLTRGEAENY